MIPAAFNKITPAQSIVSNKETVSFEGRSTFIDALRGIAAIGVACHHITRLGYGTLQEPARTLIPDFLSAVFIRASLGVQVFFVISGFVIAYSLRNVCITPKFVANYALRRSIRLDPPYWFTIAAVLLLHLIFHLDMGFVSILDIPEPMDPQLSWKLLLSHLVYMQNVLNMTNLSVGFWTLCIEVQFYLLYVMALGLIQQFDARYWNDSQKLIPPVNAEHSVQAIPVKKMRHESPAALLGVFATLALVSLFYWHQRSSNDMWISHFFCMFFLGIAAWWALDRRIPPWTFWTYVCAMIVRITSEVFPQWFRFQVNSADISDWPWDLIMALLTGTSIYFLGRIGRLANFLDFRPLQFLGRISYSLYLIHFPVLYVVSIIGDSLMGGKPTPAGSLFCLFVALALSIIAAYWMYVTIERPCVRFASRLRLKS